MDHWKLLTAISGILVVIMAAFITWEFINREPSTEELQMLEFTTTGSTTHLTPAYSDTVSCLDEALAQGAPAEHVKYMCTIEFWAEPYYRGAQLQDSVVDDKLSARYHHKCDCQFYIMQ